jgi:hypothetical protein
MKISITKRKASMDCYSSGGDRFVKKKKLLALAN